MKLYLSLILLFCSIANGAPKAQKSTKSPRTAPTPIPIQALVKKTMWEVLQNEGSGPSVSFGERSEEALPFLEPYSHSNNTDIRFAVQSVAELVPSPLALRLLSNVMIRGEEDSTISDNTLDSIADGYSQAELKQWGKESLRQGLMVLAERNEFFAKAILLLPVFPGNPTRSFLEKLRAKPFSASYKLGLNSPEVKRSFVVDIALAEMGDENGFKRLAEAIKGKSIAERVWLCHALPFIENRRVLQLVPPLLNDTRIARERSRTIHTERDDKPVEFEMKLAPFRVCDVAGRAISFKIDGSSFDYLYDGPPLTPIDIAKVRAMRF